TGAVLAMGTFIGATTKIVDRDTGEILLGRVPAYSVVVPGSLPGKALPDGRPGPSLYCAVIVKKVDESTRARTSINELLCERAKPSWARRRSPPRGYAGGAPPRRPRGRPTSSPPHWRSSGSPATGAPAGTSPIFMRGAAAVAPILALAATPMSC